MTVLVVSNFLLHPPSQGEPARMKKFVIFERVVPKLGVSHSKHERGALPVSAFGGVCRCSHPPLGSR